MLSSDEKRFLEYWDENREKKKKVYRQLSVGLPFGTVLVLSIFLNVFSGWYTRALMAYNADKSIFLVLLLGGIGIAVFFTVYAAKHSWDMNEQRYLELKEKLRKGAANSDIK